MPLLLYGCHNPVQSVNKCHSCYMDVIIQSSLSTNATSVIWILPLYSPTYQQRPLLLYVYHHYTVQSVNKGHFCYMDVIISPVCQQMPLLLYGYHHYTVQSVNKCHFCYMDVTVQSSLSTNATSVICIPPLYSPNCQQRPLLLYGCYYRVQPVNKDTSCLQ